MEGLSQVLEIINNKPDSMSISVSLIISFLFAMIMYLAYKFSYTKQEYNPKFAVTLISLALISTILMDLIKSNLALSLGMLGSLSIVRFRTNIKDPRDIGFIFWSMAIGIASATQSYFIGILGSVVLAIIMIVTKKKYNDIHTMLLVVRGSQTDINDVQNVIFEHTSNYNVKAKNILSDSFEIVYEVDINLEEENNVINDIFKMKGIDSVNLLAQNN